MIPAAPSGGGGDSYEVGGDDAPTIDVPDFDPTFGAVEDDSDDGGTDTDSDDTDSDGRGATSGYDDVTHGERTDSDGTANREAAMVETVADSASSRDVAGTVVSDVQGAMNNASEELQNQIENAVEATEESAPTEDELDDIADATDGEQGNEEVQNQGDEQSERPSLAALAALFGQSDGSEVSDETVVLGLAGVLVLGAVVVGGE